LETYYGDMVRRWMLSLQLSSNHGVLDEILKEINPIDGHFDKEFVLKLINFLIFITPSPTFDDKIFIPSLSAKHHQAIFIVG
jgi:hypothetical protein